jgi:hypothetical protein
MKIENPINKNYCATVVQLKHFRKLENCDNVKAAIIFGCSVIVSKDTKEGDIGIFFPVETQLTKDFLRTNNLHRDASLNADNTKKGYFEEHGRIRAVKFRGHKSEGFYIPISSLTSFIDQPETIAIGTEFDKINDTVICRKYVPRMNRASGSYRQQVRKVSLEDNIKEGQFAFHYDTAKLSRNLDQIKPNSIISITDKLHGTSAVFGNLLVKRKLSWWEKALVKLGVNIKDEEYDYVWSSRRVVKGVGEPKQDASHYYDTDVWTDTFNEIKELIPQGYTIYGEIVGYTKEGSPIQKGYHYGCLEKKHKLYVYRVTVTSNSGKVVELSWPQVVEFCQKLGLDHVPEIYYGRAYDFAFPVQGEWEEKFLETVNTSLVEGKMCKYHDFKVPAEGVVVRIDRLDHSLAFKHKNFAFLEWESKMLDSGVVDMESEESDAVPEN